MDIQTYIQTIEYFNTRIRRAAKIQDENERTSTLETIYQELRDFQENNDIDTS